MLMSNRSNARGSVPPRMKFMERPMSGATTSAFVTMPRHTVLSNERPGLVPFSMAMPASMKKKQTWLTNAFCISENSTT